MAHAQKPDFVIRRNGRVHLNRWGRQFSRLLAAEVYASALVMLDTPRSEVVWKYWLPTPFSSFPFTSPPVPHRMPSGFKRALQGSQTTSLLSVNIVVSYLYFDFLVRNMPLCYTHNGDTSTQDCCTGNFMESIMYKLKTFRFTIKGNVPTEHRCLFLFSEPKC